MEVSSLTSKNYNMYIKDFYSSNRQASQSKKRYAIGSRELVEADSSALKKISQSLNNLDYSQDNGSELFYTVKSFVTAYNNLCDSSGNTKQYEISKAQKFLKNLTKDQTEALQEIGITVSSSGKLELDEDELSSSSPQKLAKIFSSDNDFSNKISFYANKILKTACHVDIQI